MPVFRTARLRLSQPLTIATLEIYWGFQWFGFSFLAEEQFPMVGSEVIVLSYNSFSQYQWLQFPSSINQFFIAHLKPRFQYRITWKTRCPFYISTSRPPATDPGFVPSFIFGHRSRAICFQKSLSPIWSLRPFRKFWKSSMKMELGHLPPTKFQVLIRFFFVCRWWVGWGDLVEVEE